MKEFALLRCYPCFAKNSTYSNPMSGNTCIDDCKRNTKVEAISFFQLRWPLLCLNDSGYSKIDDITYVVAESF
jgi:hypothetical protein